MAKKVTRPSHRREDRRPRPPARSVPVARPKQVFPSAPESPEDDGQSPPAEGDDSREPAAGVRPRQRLRPGPQDVRPGAASGAREESPRRGVAAARLRPPAPIIVDYAYVRRDLVRIAVLAGAMLVALVVLTFFYR